MASTKNNVSYDMLLSLHNKLTRLNGVITLEAIDRFENELGGIFTVTKHTPLRARPKYGHLASAILEPKYRLINGNVTWIHTIPADPGMYFSSRTTRAVCGRAHDTDEELQ
jgi:hypothetical protein